MCFWLPVENLEVEPVSIAFCVCVNLAEKIVFNVVDQECRVQISRLKITVELEQLVLVNVVGQLCFHIFAQVVV